MGILLYYLRIPWVYYFISASYLIVYSIIFYTYNIVLSIYLSLLIIEKVWQLNGSASRSSRYEVKKEENRRWDLERAPTMAPLGRVGFSVPDSFR